jgi:hypothetical protein
MHAYLLTATATRQVLVGADNINRTAYMNVDGSESVAIGGPTVTFATGLLLVKAAVPLAVFIPAGQALYCICDTNKTDGVRVLLPALD